MGLESGLDDTVVVLGLVALAGGLIGAEGFPGSGLSSRSGERRGVTERGGGGGGDPVLLGSCAFISTQGRQGGALLPAAVALASGEIGLLGAPGQFGREGLVENGRAADHDEDRRSRSAPSEVPPSRAGTSRRTPELGPDLLAQCGPLHIGHSCRRNSTERFNGLLLGLILGLRLG